MAKDIIDFLQGFQGAQGAQGFQGNQGAQGFQGIQGNQGSQGSTNISAPRVNGTTSSAAPTPDVDTTDLYNLTALAVGATFGAPTGTPVNGQKLIIRIKDNGGAQTLAFNAAYSPGGISLPTTTVAGKIMHLGFMYNTDNSLNKWQLIAYAVET